MDEVKRRVMSIPEVGTALGISRAKAYDIANRKDFKECCVISLGHRKVVHAEKFEKWLEEQIGKDSEGEG